MRYAGMNPADVVCGKGVGVAVYVQGCDFHCSGCFNPQTWSFSGGKLWDKDMDDKLITDLDHPYIKRLSILGGEPLNPKNLKGVEHILDVADNLKHLNKWIFSGYTWDEIISDQSSEGELRRNIISRIDYLIEGRFDENLKDLTLEFRGSSNQRLIDIKKTIEKGEVVTI